MQLRPAKSRRRHRQSSSSLNSRPTARSQAATRVLNLSRSPRRAMQNVLQSLGPVYTIINLSGRPQLAPVLLPSSQLIASLCQAALSTMRRPLSLTHVLQRVLRTQLSIILMTATPTHTSTSRPGLFRTTTSIHPLSSRQLLFILVQSRTPVRTAASLSDRIFSISTFIRSRFLRQRFATIRLRRTSLG